MTVSREEQSKLLEGQGGVTSDESGEALEEIRSDTAAGTGTPNPSAEPAGEIVEMGYRPSQTELLALGESPEVLANRATADQEPAADLDLSEQGIEAVIAAAVEAGELSEAREGIVGSRRGEVGRVLARDNPEYTAERYRFAEQCYLLDNLTELAEMHVAAQTTESRNYGVLPNYKYNKTHILTGDGSTMMNKLKSRKDSEALINAKPDELSRLMPMIKLFKVIYNGKIEGAHNVDYEIPIKFANHNIVGGAHDDIVDTYLRPAPGRDGVGIKSFDWEYIGTNPDTVRNDIKAKLVLFFQSFSDLIVCRSALTPDNADVKYRYLDLIVHAGGSSVCDDEPVAEGTTVDDTSDEVGCDQRKPDYDSSFYEIRAVVGLAPTDSKDLDPDLLRSITANQTALYLTLEEHEFGINQDGTFTLTINYRGRLDGVLSSPKSNVLNPNIAAAASTHDPFGLVYYMRLIDVQTKIEEIKSQPSCAEDEAETTRLQELNQEKIALGDQLRNHQYKKFAYALKDPSGRYVNYPQQSVVSGDGTDTEAMPLIHSLRVTKRDIDRFVTTGTGKLTPGSSSPRRDEDGNIIVGGLTGQGTGRSGQDPLGEMESDIKDEPYEDLSEVPEGTAKYSLKDYSILDTFPRGAAGGARTPGSAEALLNFFYLGDLLDIIATDVFDSTIAELIAFAEEGRELVEEAGLDPTALLTENEAIMEMAKKNAFSEAEVENLRVLLGPFEYIDPRNPRTVKRINIGDIPISFRMYVEFCQRKMIRKRRQVYPFIDFVRDLINDLVVRALGAQCFGRNGAKGIRIRLGYLDGPAVENSENVEQDPIEAKAIEQVMSSQRFRDLPTRDMGSIQGMLDNTTRLNMDDVKTHQPIFDYDRSLQTKDTYQYLFIYTEGPAGLKHPSRRDPDDPLPPEERDRVDKGIHHLHIGQDRGLVKSIEFSKTDVPGYREARVEKSGTFDPIAQLSDVYEATITLFGNTFFYPGSYVYINPFGLASHRRGGAGGLGLPHIKNSISNIMGLGGYHIIIGVSNYIEEGKFETTVRARFEASGDGCKVTAAENNNDTNCDEIEAEAIDAPPSRTPPVGSEGGPDIPGR